MAVPHATKLPPLPHEWSGAALAAGVDRQSDAAGINAFAVALMISAISSLDCL
jgi:hypothetical protein